MPKRNEKKRLILYLMSLMAFFFIKCSNGNQKTAFPVSESEYSLPVEKPLKFGDTSIIKWKITPQDSIKPLPEIKFDLAKIPSKPFDFGVDIPFVQELKEKSFDLDKIQDTIFDFRKLPTYSLLFRTSILERPKTTKARYPTVKIGAARGVMEIGKEMGLNGVGRCFLQDKNGQIWIGTDKGLWRYDGENFESYSIVTEYNIDNITSLVEDDQEGMWVGTNSGRLFQLEIKKGLIHEVKDTLPISAIYSMMKDQAGRIWVAVSGFGIRIIDIKEKTIKQFTNKEGLVQNLNTKMMQDHQGGIWITSTSGVNLIDTKKHLNKRISQKNGLNNPAAFSLLEDRNHQIWIGGTNGVDIINRQKRTLLHLAKAQGLDSITFIPGLYQDQVGKVWVGTDKGIVFKVDVEKQVFEKLKINPGVQNVIYQFSEDKNKQVWIGALQGGCYLINPNNGRPGNFTESNGLGGENIWSIQEDKQGNLWVGTYTGIDIINRANKTIKHIDHNNGLLQDRASQLYIDKKGRIWANAGQFGCNIIDLERGVIQHLTKAQGLPFNQCGTFFEDKNGFMWIGSQGGKICRLNLPNKLIMRIENSPESSSNPINTIIEDSNEQLWLTKQVGGVLVIDKSRKTIKPLSAQQGILSSETTSVFEDQNKNIWIATEKGVEQLDVSNKTISSFTVKEGLSSNGVYTIDEFNGQIILGSSTGFNFLSKTPSSKTKEWKIFSLDYQQGLIALDVAQNSTFFTKEGQIWAGVEDQILTVIDYPKTDTIINNPFITGINILDKPQMFGDKQYFELAIKNIDTIWKAEKDSFYRNKEDLVAHYFPQKNKLTWDSTSGPYFLPVNLQLPIDQNFLSFTFTGTNLANADKTKYRYILEGIDKKWSPITENAVSENYRDLPAGYYTFRVASKSMNGIWSKPAEFSFTILPPWWQSWWAYLIYLLFFVGILRAYIVFRSRSLQRENQVLDEKITLRTQQLQKTIEDLKTTQNQLVLSEKMASLGELTAGIAHEIQNPLNFINNFSEVNAELIDEMEEELSKGNLEEVSAIAKDIKGNEEKITFHGKRADNIVKGMLQHSRASTGKKEATDINALADEYLRLAYHGLRAKDKSFNATMKTDFDETIGNIQVISQDIGRVVLNLITNAFYAVTDKKKKGIDGFEPTVWVSTKKVGNKVEIRVKDNGMGVPSKVIEKIFQPFFSTKPTGEGTGLGLSMSYDIVTKGHEGELIVNTQEGEFAEFVILLPILNF